MAMWKILEEKVPGGDCTLRELRDREVNMFTTVFIGNSETEILGDKLITRRGYQAEKGEKAE